jgi:CRISPR-associated protein Csb2
MGMGQQLVLTISHYDGRYHGAPEWPPAPARVFQALVAGVARGSTLPAWVAPALEWLERLPPPVVAAPRARLGNPVDLFVPNNDADAVGGDPARVSEIRTKKLVQPHLLENGGSFVYAWPLADGPGEYAPILIKAATELYQFGRGVDPAWAIGELLDGHAVSARLSAPGTVVYLPGSGTGDHVLACPTAGSLDSLIRRHNAGASKLRADIDSTTPRILFSQPPKPYFIPVGYGGLSHDLVYELRAGQDLANLTPWPLARVVMLIERVRNGGAKRLQRALPEQHDAIERTLIGRKLDGRETGPTTQRVRIVPLPSIGHEHVDPAVRRVLVEIPRACSLAANDIRWAFSGLETADPDTGEVDPFVLTATTDHSMLHRYVGAEGARRWRSITAVALPEGAKRRRLEPSRQREESKAASERIEEEARARIAVLGALRHAEIRQRAVDIRVQREPFDRRGSRAEMFAEGTRFSKHQLWHIQITFEGPVVGPLVIGDGRFLGLGVMAPGRDQSGIHAFEIVGGLAPKPEPGALARALRRAVMSRVQTLLGERIRLPAFFCGHDVDGKPARSELARHLIFAFEPRAKRLLIVAPHHVDKHNPKPIGREVEWLRQLDEALIGFLDLRAGGAGHLRLREFEAQWEGDPILGSSTSWESITTYQVTRHAKKVGATEAFAADVRSECSRRGLPDVRVTPLELRAIPGAGLTGMARLDFNAAVKGPIILGRTRHLGGGLFVKANQH